MALTGTIQDKLDAKRMVIIDGATGTEIGRRGGGAKAESCVVSAG